MPVIKRYPNRKLYDTEAKRYITLDGVTELIRQGEEVHVIDHRTNEDMTAVVLSQIILEQEKRTGGFLPKSLLTGLVKAGGDTLAGLRRNLTSPLDLLRYVDEEIEGRLHALIARGELAREEGARLREKLIGHTGLLGERDLEGLLRKSGIPTRRELQELSDRLDGLAAKLEQLDEP